MKKISILLICLFAQVIAFSQDTTVTVYFKNGQSGLTPPQLGVLHKLQDRPVSKMTFEGYADTVGKASFNQKLSYKRAEKAARTIKAGNKQVFGKGISREKGITRDKMRKVVIKVWYNKAEPAPRPIQVNETEKIKKAVVVADPCKGDTVLDTESGSMIKMNTCFYLKVKHCFTYKEFLSAKRAQQAGLRTVDEKGNPIMSGGMIDIGFCSDTCLITPIIIYLPVPECLTQQSMTIWTMTRNNTWKNSKNKLEVVKIKGRDYYKMIIYCPGKINCDRPIPVLRQVKVKLKNGLKFKSATLSGNCPLYSLDAKFRKRRNVAFFLSPCPKDDPLIYIKAYTKSGDTLIINNENINQYSRKRKLFSSCNCQNKSKERFWGIFKIRRKYLYKKYKIYQSDFGVSGKDRNTK